MNKSITYTDSLLGERKRILVTGGGGFIGGAVIRKLLKESSAIVFNLDKMGYASDSTSIDQLLRNGIYSERYKLFKLDLIDSESTSKVIKLTSPDLIMHLAAESHVDRSINGPKEFIESNIIGTYNLLEATRNYYENLSNDKRKNFRFLHISTDEVFGSIIGQGLFSEDSPYKPKSPYSATKAASDHLVQAWHNTYGLPTILTNCSNNFGPWQFPEKLIPVVITKAAALDPIPLYGDGKNIRDWLYVEDHVDALILAANKGKIGDSYCVGGYGERENIQIVKKICEIMNQIRPQNSPHENLITQIKDRPGHDRRYAIDPRKIKLELGWKPKYSLEERLEATVRWYLNNQKWSKKMIDSNQKDDQVT